MKIGFTGTRGGMSGNQMIQIIEMFQEHGHKITDVIHGGCIGSDEQFHKLALMFLDANIHVRWGHSSKNSSDKRYRANLTGDYIEYDSMPYLDRNRLIVSTCDVLTGTPKNMIESGGTWYTLNYAKKVKKPYIIFKP